MKAIIISVLLSLCATGTRSEIGIVTNSETIETADGNLWCVDSDELRDIVGSTVVVTFDNYGTEIIYDDEIISIDVIK